MLLLQPQFFCGPMKYRSSTEIIDTILRSLESGVTRTRIMYKAYLSYSQLKEYLALLEGRDLLKYEEGTQRYTITEKGVRFISAYENIRELVSDDNLPMQNVGSTPQLKKTEIFNL
jgi:predicted transcriptional regulator